MLYQRHPFDGDSFAFRREKRVKVKKVYGVLDQIIEGCLTFSHYRRIDWN